MSKKVSNKVTWVGKVDWTLDTFHGKEYSTHKGSSYNSYLVRDSKTVLIDTVWQPYGKEFVENLKSEIALDEIDYIIANHAEIDHSGALEQLMDEIPDTPIYCTSNGVKSLKGHYHKDWNFVTVKTGDVLDLGESKLIFIEAPMLHWPDSMFTYMTGENIFFSNDAFGQHYSSEFLFNDLVDKAELDQESIKYYANILTPFSKAVINKIEEILSLSVKVDMICPAHGVIWRKDPLMIVNKYLEWAKDYKENQITIIFDTMWNSTKKIAEYISAGIQNIDPSVNIKIFNSAIDDKNDIITEIFKSKAIIAGSPTINNGYLYSISGILEMIKGLKFKGKKAAAFGSYGWSGEAVGKILEELKVAGFEVFEENIRSQWIPSIDDKNKLIEYGKKLAKFFV